MCIAPKCFYHLQGVHSVWLCYAVYVSCVSTSYLSTISAAVTSASVDANTFCVEYMWLAFDTTPCQYLQHVTRFSLRMY